MNIDSIKRGIVIDHIPAGESMEIYQLLGLEDLDCSVAIIKNAPSKKFGKKDIIKIDGSFEPDIDILGYIDPNITINIIRDGERTKKLHPGLPERLVNVVKCKNPRCITSTEQEIDHIFCLTDPKKHIYRCIYCDTAAKQ